MFVKLGLQLNSDMSIRICSEASIAESPLLAAVISLENISNSLPHYPCRGLIVILIDYQLIEQFHTLLEIGAISL